MKRLIATLTIAAACWLAGPAQAHCPNACSTGWFYANKATGSNGYSTAFGYPVRPDAKLSSAEVDKILNVSFDRYHSIEYLITSWVKGHTRKSPSAIYALHWAKYGWRYTPMAITEVNRLHGCTVDENPAGGYYHWFRWSCLHF